MSSTQWQEILETIVVVHKETTYNLYNQDIVVKVYSKHMTIVSLLLESEREENYSWEMKMLKSLIVSNILPEVMIADRELTLMNSVRRVFPSTINI